MTTKRISIPSDVWELAPNDTGCRAATLLSALQQLSNAIDNAHLSISMGSGIRQLIETREDINGILKHLYPHE